MTQLYNQFASMRVACLVTHIGLWLLGMTGMYYCLSSIAAGARMRVRVEENLREEVRHRLSLEKTLREAATTDSLTKLLNRGAMLERLSLEVARYMRNDVVFALLMADIDFFKQLNDSRGHEAGDRVLVEIANRIRSALRAQDAVARWGGEEFLVLLPETELTSAYMVGEKIRKCVDGIPINLGGDIFTVTISIGVTEFRPELDIAFSIKCADNALYAAKKKGRNRVEMSVP
jgi:diguanylate cyclase (GGDEF)-like protein